MYKRCKILRKCRCCLVTSAVNSDPSELHNRRNDTICVQRVSRLGNVLQYGHGLFKKFNSRYVPPLSAVRLSDMQCSYSGWLADGAASANRVSIFHPDRESFQEARPDI